MIGTSRAILLGTFLIALGALVHPVAGLAQQTSPAETIDPPLPEPRPADGPMAAEEQSEPDPEASDRSEGTTTEPPLPRSRPDEGPSDEAGEGGDGSASEAREGDEAGSDESDERPAALAPPTETVPEGMSAAEITRCEKDLKALGATFEVLEPIAGKNGCGVARPYNVTEIDGVAVRPATQMTCDTALALSRWVRSLVQPSAAALGPDVRVTGITHASTYVCRRRNNQPTGKLSEHAKGQAIDIISFSFDGHKPLPIMPRAGKGTMQEAFQRTVQAGGCLHFTTVLGPGSDDYHDDHLHMDTIARSSGYRLCQ